MTALAEQRWRSIGVHRRKIIIAFYVAIATGIVMIAWIKTAIESTETGWDFPVFYIAAHLPTHLLYSRSAIAAFWQEHLAPLGVRHWAPYVRPAVFSLLLRPLAQLPYWRALWLWVGAGLTVYFASVAILLRKFRLPGLLLPAYAGFFPALAGVIVGADATVYLLALILALILLEHRSDKLAACLLIACLCKFNLVLLVPVMLLLQRRYQALLTFGAGAVLVATASFALVPFGVYVTALVETPKNTAGFFPVGLRGLSAAIAQPWTYPILAAAVIVLCCWLMKRLPITEAFCVAIVGTLLISPYVTYYDSTLLALPLAVVFAHAGTPIRIICVAVLAGTPLWEHGGGNNGPIGFTHVAVELFILGYFMQAALSSAAKLTISDKLCAVFGRREAAKRRSVVSGSSFSS
jgi:hypothetical protein